MKLDVELTPREEVPRWMGYGTPVFTILAALAVSAVALVALDVSPLAAYRIMFVQTLTTSFGLTETVAKAVPLIFVGLAVYLPLKAQLWNIGAEGQLFLGAIAGTWVGVNVSLPTYALLPLMFVAGGLAGAVWIAVPAWLRAKLGINEIITTLLFVFIATEIKNYLVRGPMQAPGANFPQTPGLPAAARLPDLPIVGFPAGIVLAIALVGLIHVLLNYTRLGFEITFIGANDEAAEHAGMSKFKIYMIVLLSGGAIAGFAGVSEMAGVQGRLRAQFAPGYGFTAIPIALLGRNGAVQVMLAALFFAVLFVGGSSIQTLLSVPAAIVNIIQALVILFLITAEFFKQYSIDLSLTKRPDSNAAGRVEGDL
ncbi:ABC transporter permease [Haloarcula sp. S1CR25-12]|uniref:ABC transporter permease n=1 Tax=Haloarcula saliterrae TaxID=2950534 RepID=A0ABU2FFT1_9EURY|nr:ABC transporter permease [Haloarcula sp. S1CR25-12]MDS0261120.1 ABC transporter permease [Haloarcula sp. S1CR25-12]